jgi:hypothetical protein
MSRTIRRTGITRKKTLIAAERDEQHRADWRQEMADVDPTTLVFLDETSTQVTMTRRHGRCWPSVRPMCSRRTAFPVRSMGNASMPG